MPIDLRSPLNDWIVGTDVPAAAEAVFEALSVLDPMQVSAELRRLRRCTLWSWAVGTERSVEAWRARLKTRLGVTAREHCPYVLSSCLGHPNGFLRQAAAEYLVTDTDFEATAALVFAADDHVEQVRRIGQVALRGRPLDHLALLCGAILSRPADVARSHWRAAAAGRLRTAAGVEALHRVAACNLDRQSDSAVQLLCANESTVAVDRLAAAPSWRVRLRVARLAVSIQDRSVCSLLLHDTRVAVRYALVWAASYEADPFRMWVMLSALPDQSVRVLRIAAAHCREVPAAHSMLDALLSSADERDRIKGLRVLPMLRGRDSRAALEASLHVPSPRERRTAYHALREAGLLGEQHLQALKVEPDAAVAAVGLRQLIRALGRLPPGAVPMIRSGVLRGHPSSAALLLHAPHWDSTPLYLQALSEGWPRALTSLEVLLKQWQQGSVRGWLLPNDSQRAALQHALDTYATSIPVEARPLTEHVRRVLKDPA